MTNMHPVSFDPVSVLLRVDQINPVTLAEFPGTRTFVERLVYDMSATSMSLLVMPEATARFLAPARHVSAHSPEPDISRSDDTVYSAVLAELTGVTAPILDHSEEPISVSANFGNIVLALGLYLVHRLTDRRARGASDTADLLAKDKALWAWATDTESARARVMIRPTDEAGIVVMGDFAEIKSKSSR